MPCPLTRATRGKYAPAAAQGLSKTSVNSESRGSCGRYDAAPL